MYKITSSKIYKIVVFLLLIAALVFIVKNRDLIFSEKYSGDLHIHTNCSDGNSGYEETIQKAIGDRLSFIAITDHRICADMLEQCKAETRIKCFPGLEISSERTHLLAIGTYEYIDPDFSIAKQVEEIHSQGGIAIAAHPNAPEYYYEDSELKDSGIDLQECTGNYKERRFLPCVWDSDAHKLESLGWQHTSCINPINTASDLKNEVLLSKCIRSVSASQFFLPKTEIISE